MFMYLDFSACVQPPAKGRLLPLANVSAIEQFKNKAMIKLIKQVLRNQMEIMACLTPLLKVPSDKEALTDCIQETHKLLKQSDE